MGPAGRLSFSYILILLHPLDTESGFGTPNNAGLEMPSGIFDPRTMHGDVRAVDKTTKQICKRESESNETGRRFLVEKLRTLAFRRRCAEPPRRFENWTTEGGLEDEGQHNVGS